MGRRDGDPSIHPSIRPPTHPSIHPWMVVRAAAAAAPLESPNDFCWGFFFPPRLLLSRTVRRTNSLTCAHPRPPKFKALGMAQRELTFSQVNSFLFFPLFFNFFFFFERGHLLFSCRTPQQCHYYLFFFLYNKKDFWASSLGSHGTLCLCCLFPLPLRSKGKRNTKFSQLHSIQSAHRNMQNPSNIFFFFLQFSLFRIFAALQ